MSDPRKDALKKAWREQENQKLLASIPMPKEELKALFDHLDVSLAQSCDHTLRLTTAFLESKKLEVQRVVPWLREHCGYCDCEVLANVEDEFGDLIR
jgi:coproporphyrinogen III oxidase-like Fe-S oxidoreductase